MPATPLPAHQINEKHAIGYALGAVLMWSTVATGFKLGLAVLSIAQLLLLGTWISWLVFLVYALAKRSFQVASSDRWLTLGLGCINPFAYYLVLFAAYDRLPAHIAQPLNYTWAITLALLAVPILKQRLSLRTLAGILISYAGVTVLLVTSTDGAQGGWNTTGVVLALLSTVLWAGYWLLNTRAHSPPAAMMFWSFTAALPLITLVCWLGPGLPTLDTQTLSYGAWVGCIEMGVTFLLWQQALRKTANAARIGQLIFLSPFLSLLIIQAVLQESIGIGVVFGLGIIVLGLHFTRSR
jgi:drug/metabolite transporter (DMT)-like permease